MLIAVVVEAWVWGVAYRLLGVIDRSEEAIYFSMVTFTTLGFGDVVLDPPWRVLSAFEAATGLVIFGWTTALVFEVVRRVYHFH